MFNEIIVFKPFVDKTSFSEYVSIPNPHMVSNFHRFCECLKLDPTKNYLFVSSENFVSLPNISSSDNNILGEDNYDCTFVKSTDLKKIFTDFANEIAVDPRYKNCCFIFNVYGQLSNRDNFPFTSMSTLENGWSMYFEKSDMNYWPLNNDVRLPNKPLQYGSSPDDWYTFNGSIFIKNQSINYNYKTRLSGAYATRGKDILNLMATDVQDIYADSFMPIYYNGDPGRLVTLNSERLAFYHSVSQDAPYLWDISALKMVQRDMQVNPPIIIQGDGFPASNYLSSQIGAWNDELKKTKLNYVENTSIDPVTNNIIFTSTCNFYQVDLSTSFPSTSTNLPQKYYENTYYMTVREYTLDVENISTSSGTSISNKREVTPGDIVNLSDLTEANLLDLQNLNYILTAYTAAPFILFADTMPNRQGTSPNIISTVGALYTAKYDVANNPGKAVLILTQRPQSEPEEHCFFRELSWIRDSGVTFSRYLMP